jgi:16S rRNA (adenine1518-N6/adenine1519-N6)-dimethyltransferase
VEVGAGFGSLTLALADTSARVLAVEFDRRLVPALREVVDGRSNVEVLAADALSVDWDEALGDEPWTMASNLPYNVAVPLLLTMLEGAPRVSPFVVMVQREVADRLAARPGAEAYGAVSAKVAYRAEVEVLRRVPREVFWPRPAIESTVLRLTRRSARLDVDVDPRALFSVIDAAFAQRRKTMSNAVRRLGLSADAAREVLASTGIEPSVRAETLDLAAFARLTDALVRRGAVPA